MASLKYGWKVITYSRRSLVVPRDSKLYYRKGRRIYPLKGWGPLAVFRAITSAEMFVTEYGPFIEWGRCPDKDSTCQSHPFYSQIVRCRYKPSKYQKLWTRFSNVTNTTYTNSIIGGGLGESWTTMFPSGTVLADFVTCLE